jgi:uncharacterized DUF497 family protein
LRLLPEKDGPGSNRYFNLGKTITDRFVWSVFWTDGKKYRIIFAREMTTEEQNFYDRKNAEFV